MSRPEYKTVALVAKTTETISGTIDRKPVPRRLLTEAEGFDGKQVVVDGDDVGIFTAAKKAEVEVWVELVGPTKSKASWKFYDVLTLDCPENEGVTEIFTDDVEKVGHVTGCAARMCSANPDCDNMWQLVDKDGKRVIVRIVDKAVTETGRRAK